MAEIYVPCRTSSPESKDLIRTLVSAAGGDANLERAWTFDTSQGELRERVPPDYSFKTKSGLVFAKPFVNGRLMLYQPAASPTYAPRAADIHIALDSNLQTPFTAFGLSRKLRPEWAATIGDLLRNGFAWGAQFQPIPYLIENIAQYSVDAARTNAIEMIEACIIINNMDFKHFEATDKVKLRVGIDGTGTDCNNQQIVDASGTDGKVYQYTDLDAALYQFQAAYSNALAGGQAVQFAWNSALSPGSAAPNDQYASMSYQTMEYLA